MEDELLEFILVKNVVTMKEYRYQHHLSLAECRVCQHLCDVKENKDESKI